MRGLLFLIYYSKRRLKVLLGPHHTPNPLNVRWRWQYWRDHRFHWQKEKERFMREKPAD
jgi:hypothetical protein